MVNTFLDSMKSPWAKLVFSLSFHFDKFHEYEKKQELLFLAYHMIFPFLYQYETDVDTSVYHNHIRSSEHGNHRIVSYQLLCWTSFLLISEYKLVTYSQERHFFWSPFDALTQLTYFSPLFDSIMSAVMIDEKRYLMVIMTTSDQEKITIQDQNIWPSYYKYYHSDLLLVRPYLWRLLQI